MYWCSGIFVFLFTIAVVLKSSEACSCLPAHPQEHFCKADFVILATVKREFLQDEAKVYKVKIRKEFKMSEKAKVALKHGRLHTALHSSQCGVDLGIKRTYLVTGRIMGLQAHISLCGFTKQWNKVSHRQRKGFKLLYARGCDCKITYCRYGTCRPSNSSCSWNINSQCQTDHGICLRNSRDKCAWTRSLALKNCLYGHHDKTSTTTVVPEPFRIPERDVTTDQDRNEASRFPRVGYYHYNKISN